MKILDLTSNFTKFICVLRTCNFNFSAGVRATYLYVDEFESPLQGQESAGTARPRGDPEVSVRHVHEAALGGLDGLGGDGNQNFSNTSRLVDGIGKKARIMLL